MDQLKNRVAEVHPGTETEEYSAETKTAIKQEINDFLMTRVQDDTITVRDLDSLALAVFDLVMNPRAYLPADREEGTAT